MWEYYLQIFPGIVSTHARKQFLLPPNTYHHWIEVKSMTWNYGCGLCGITVNGRSNQPYCVYRWTEHEESPPHKETLQKQFQMRILSLKAKPKTGKLTILE